MQCYVAVRVLHFYRENFEIQKVACFQGFYDSLISLPKSFRSFFKVTNIKVTIWLQKTPLSFFCHLDAPYCSNS